MIRDLQYLTTKSHNVQYPLDPTAKQIFRIQDPTSKQHKTKTWELKDPTMTQKFRVQDPQDLTTEETLKVRDPQDLPAK